MFQAMTDFMCSDKGNKVFLHFLKTTFSFFSYHRRHRINTQSDNAFID